VTTRLEKALKRELDIKGQTYIVTLSPEGIKLTLKGHRKGIELQWESLVSGEAALSVALNASIGRIRPREVESNARARTKPQASAAGARRPASRQVKVRKT